MYSGQTFVITGASKGIGLQYVTQVTSLPPQIPWSSGAGSETCRLEATSTGHGSRRHACSLVGRRAPSAPWRMTNHK